jgi:hypothetical protein
MVFQEAAMEDSNLKRRLNAVWRARVRAPALWFTGE